MPRKTVEQRFWEKVDKRGPDECWQWTACTGPTGYGTFDGKRAHRVSWAWANGRPVPDGLVVCHSCDNPGCVNPAHLWAGTQRDNMHDCIRKGRRAKNEESRARHERIIALYHRGLTMKEIAREIGSTRKSVSVTITYLRKRGADLPYRIPPAVPATPVESA